MLTTIQIVKDLFKTVNSLSYFTRNGEVCITGILNTDSEFYNDFKNEKFVDTHNIAPFNEDGVYSENSLFIFDDYGDIENAFNLEEIDEIAKMFGFCFVIEHDAGGTEFGGYEYFKSKEDMENFRYFEDRIGRIVKL